LRHSLPRHSRLGKLSSRTTSAPARMASSSCMRFDTSTSIHGARSVPRHVDRFSQR
jgi:hypothetical protein